ncbi:unnamed protein product [Ambrosiozyma monospora]|uniref:Unnamed protein product n=1 Tax=Ambrosiozyma monospora TaxID=43982 RepID=A0ACB5T0C6_AMBMO|nr:unnamed protein product [Ambrosiozyma monospora]
MQNGGGVGDGIHPTRDDSQNENNPKVRGQLMMIYSYLYSRMILNLRNNPQLQLSESQIAQQQLQTGGDTGSSYSLLDSNNFINMIKWKSGSDYIVGLLISTPSYEVYLINNGGLVDKSMLIQSCRSIVKWCKKNEDRLFISSGAVF